MYPSAIQLSTPLAMYSSLDEICSKAPPKGESAFVVKITLREHSIGDCVVFLCVLANFYANLSHVKLFINLANKFQNINMLKGM